MNTRTTLFLVAAPALLFQVESLPPPKHPEQPFRILVFSEPRGEAAVVARVLEAEKECQKILKRKTGSLRLTVSMRKSLWRSRTVGWMYRLPHQ
jgi:hypothetical protein